MSTEATDPPGPWKETPTHLLRQLKLPSRYETLVAAVGPSIARLLVEPSQDSLDLFRKSALHIRSRGRGLFLPVVARSGTGKTTLISNISGWVPSEFAGTARLASGGEVSAERLRQAAEEAVERNSVPVNDKRILVINVDDRESDPPSDKELSQIKSFVRESGEGSAGLGSRTLVVWPETSRATATQMARDYEERAGASPVAIPADVGGPSRETWAPLALTTLQIVNNIENLEALGVDPQVYDPAAYETVGDYLDKINSDFVGLLDRLLTATRKPVRLVVSFASESGKAGVLSELSSGHRYGSVDAHRLLSATPNSAIGRWWSERVGQLVQSIVRLDVRATFVAPSLSVPVIARYGPTEAKAALADLGSSVKPPAHIGTYFARSDFGRLLLNNAQAASEIRGNPAADAGAAFALLAEQVGFSRGVDKKLNLAFGDFLTQTQAQLGECRVEKRAEFLPLIPDISFVTDDHVTCVEFHWRAGDFLTSTHRSEVAQYILTKVKSYAIELEWISS